MIIKVFRKFGSQLMGAIQALKLMPKFGISKAYQFYIIRESNLFDFKFYTTTYGKPDLDENRAILDFINAGNDEGLNPNEYFDTKWYKENMMSGSGIESNVLIHYITIGDQKGVSTGPNFDSRIYLKNNPDLQNYPKTMLTHFLIYGKREGRVAYSSAHKSLLKQPIHAPKLEAFDEFIGGNNYSDRILIDVIIPVYRGYDDTLNCIYSIYKSSNTIPFRIVVVNDCSPEPKLTDALKQLSEKGLFHYIYNDKNLGFVESVNKGMKADESSDVILLNSDTEVYNDWLDRLYSQAQKKDVYTVTPLSNNATICSYPKWPEDNVIPLEITYSAIDLLAKKYNKNQHVGIPTAVGFCMYIKRDALKELGYFDVEKYKQGYGEENDFSLRVSNSGKLNSLAVDVFVRHTGEVSFAEESNEKKNKGLKTLLNDYPDYNKIIQSHINEDPSLVFRQNLDIARITDKKVNTLIITHNWGGGIERYLRDKINREAENGYIIIRSNQKQELSFKMDSINSIDLPNVENMTFDDISKWSNWVRLFNIQNIEIHSLAGWNENVLFELTKWSIELGLKYDFYIHDYLSICPSAHFINQDENLCDMSESCKGCSNSLNDINSVEEWRTCYKGLLKNAENIIAPSNDAAKRIGDFFDIKVEVYPHVEDLTPLSPSLAREISNNEVINIGIIGAINRDKGSEIIDRLAQYCFSNKLPYKFTIIGHTNNEKLLKYDNVSITGPYKENEVYQLIDDNGLHLAMFPSIVPETYCFSLSIALKAGIPCIAFDLGAQAERLKNGEEHLILPYQIRNKPEIILEHIKDKYIRS